MNTNIDIDERVRLKNDIDNTIKDEKNNNYDGVLELQRKINKYEEIPSEDAIAGDLLGELHSLIIDELTKKNKSRNFLTKWLVYWFTLITFLIIFLVIYSNVFDISMVKIVVGGFFANSVALVLVLLKYVYSPSKDVYKYSVDVFNRNRKEMEQKKDY